MIIRSVELQNYRNYEGLQLTLSSGVNILYGDNAQGKTNALESLFFCATGKSHRSSKDKELIRFGEEEAHIKMILEKQEIPHRIDMHLRKTGHKGIAIDGMPIRRAVDLLGVAHMIFFSPEDLSIVKDAPQERRSFIDMELCQLDRIYTHNLINYNKIILQKNKLLKQIEEEPDLRDTLDIWNAQLLQYAIPIIRRRREFIRELEAVMKEVHISLTSGTEMIRAEYEPNRDEEGLKEALERDGIREQKAKTSLFGPHRDDIGFYINDVDVRTYGSQGQQRTTALSLKLSEIEMVKRTVKDTPVLLLDDVLSELDSSRQEKLLQSIAGIQTVMTCTGLDDFVEKNCNIDRVFHIQKGTLIQA